MEDQHSQNPNKMFKIESDDLRLERINQSNYREYMVKYFKLESTERDDKCIEILKKCFSFIDFFKKVVEFDPNDKLLSMKNSCKYLFYKKYQKGDILMKHRAPSEEFFINLSGKIAVMIQRKHEQKVQDVQAVEYALSESIEKQFITKKELIALSRGRDLSDSLRKSLKSFKKIENGNVTYNDDIVYEFNGGHDISQIILEKTGTVDTHKVR